jgi:hypothetical protein
MLRNRMFVAGAAITLGLGVAATAAVAHGGDKPSLRPATVSAATDETTTTEASTTTEAPKTTEAPSTTAAPKAPEAPEAPEVDEPDGPEHDTDADELDHDDDTPPVAGAATKAKATAVAHHNGTHPEHDGTHPEKSGDKPEAPGGD